MAKNRKNTKSILLDLHYKHPKNTFEEFYGYSISYAEIEQVSYIDLKEMAFEKINRRIKFRKFGRDKGVLTVKMDVTPLELGEFMSILISGGSKERYKGKVEIIIKETLETFNFLHDFIITNVRDLTNEERVRFKKAIIESDSEIELENTKEDLGNN